MQEGQYESEKSEVAIEVSKNDILSSFPPLTFTDLDRKCNKVKEDVKVKLQTWEKPRKSNERIQPHLHLVTDLGQLWGMCPMTAKSSSLDTPRLQQHQKPSIMKTMNLWMLLTLLYFINDMYCRLQCHRHTVLYSPWSFCILSALHYYKLW